MAIALVLLTACMETDADVVIHDDRTATVVVEVIPDRRSWSDLGSLASLDPIVEALSRDAPPGVSVERVDGDRSSGIRLRWERLPVEQLSQPFRFGDTTDALVVQLFTSFEVTDRDDVWQVDAATAPAELTAAVVTGGRVDELSGAEVSLRIQVPGRVVVANTPEHDRSSATWTIDPRSKESATLMVRSEPGLGLDRAWLLVAGAGGLVLVGVVLVVAADRVRVRRRLRRVAAARPDQRWSDDAGASAPTQLAGPVGDRSTTASDAPKGMYQDLTGDDSMALPVGGRSWGRAPDPSASDGSARPASDLTLSAPPASPASARAPGGHVRSLDRPHRPDTPSGRPPVPPGWYPDPDRPGGQRFWDGRDWSEHRS